MGVEFIKACETYWDSDNHFERNVYALFLRYFKDCKVLMHTASDGIISFGSLVLSHFDKKQNVFLSMIKKEIFSNFDI